MIDQKADGDSRFVFVGPDKVVQLSGSSFAAIYGQSPEVMEERFFQFLRDRGIGLPKMKTDSSVRERIELRSQKTSEELREQFSQLVMKLDHGDFGTRQRAYRELSENVQKYSVLIKELHDETHLTASAESRARLSELHKQYEENFGEIDDLIDRAEWLRQ
ncbi:MAG: hypothetical protein AAF802_17015 [Planctomycetota bacterium]